MALSNIFKLRHISKRDIRISLWYWLLMSIKYYKQGVCFPLDMSIRGTFYVFKHRDADIRFGSNIRIVNRLKYNPVGVVHPTVLRAMIPGAKITIGNRVGISGAVICCETSITVGDNCLLGANCSILDSDYHPLNYLDRRLNRQDLVKRAPIQIGDDCWIGANAMILKGVMIGARSVIGANSVVTTDIPADSIAAGNPARVIAKVLN